MTKAEILRKELYKNGFYIEKELTARENGRNYVIMSVYYDGESREITDAFAYSGKVTDKEYLSLVCRKLRHAGNRKYNINIMIFLGEGYESKRYLRVSE